MINNSQNGSVIGNNFYWHWGSKTLASHFFTFWWRSQDLRLARFYDVVRIGLVDGESVLPKSIICILPDSTLIGR